MLSAWRKHQIVDINIQGLSLAKNNVVFQNAIFPSGKHKLEVMKDLIHYMLSFKCEQPYFMKITYLTFESEHKSSIDLKLGFSQCWS